MEEIRATMIMSFTSKKLKVKPLNTKFLLSNRFAQPDIKNKMLLDIIQKH